MAYDIPADFDRFWQAVREESEIPTEFERRPTSLKPLPSHNVELIDFDGMTGTVHGWIAWPNEMSESAPAFLWLAAYGRESHLPDEFSTRPGFISMSFNFHGHAAFHKEAYKPERGYFAEGVAEPETWIFRRMAQDAFVALRVLAAQPKVDSGRLSVAGLSQGGGMAVWVGANSDLPKRVVADMPFLSDMGRTLSGDVYRYPLKELVDFSKTLDGGMERILKTISYFDTAHQATRLTKPTLMSLGLKDPAVRPESVRAVFANLAAEDKRLIEYEIGHDWHEGMIANNREFMLA